MPIIRLSDGNAAARLTSIAPTILLDGTGLPAGQYYTLGPLNPSNYGTSQVTLCSERFINGLWCAGVPLVLSPFTAGAPGAYVGVTPAAMSSTFPYLIRAGQKLRVTVAGGGTIDVRVAVEFSKYAGPIDA